ncbi:MAG: hypothetical protein ACI9AA_003532 [Alteromonas sp.]
MSTIRTIWAKFIEARSENTSTRSRIYGRKPF